MDEISARRLYLTGFILIALALFYAQIMKGEFYLNKARNNYIRVIPIRSMRGTIFDRHGVPLAADKASFNIAVVPYQIRMKKELLFRELADYAKVDIRKLYRNYAQELMGMFKPVTVLRNLDKPVALKIQEQFGIDVLINPEPDRRYPYPKEFAHVLGYVKPVTSVYADIKKYDYSPLERAGVSGVEQYYNTYLRGEDGGDLVEVDAGGRRVGFIGQEKPVPGNDIYLTIDAKIQKYAYDILAGRRGCAIMMNSSTGEVICLTSSPSFDPNLFVTSGAGQYFIDPQKPLLNRAVQAVYPLGSVFKPIEAAGALEDKIITPHTSFTCTGVFVLGAARFHCWSTHGVQDMYQALAHSCDVYFYNVGRLCGPEILSKWSKRFGLDSLTEIDLPGEKKGLVPSPDWKKETLNLPWYGGDTLNFSIGQGFMLATPMEFVEAMNVFACGGDLVRPCVLKQVGELGSATTKRTHVNISERVLNEVQTGIGMVASSDTGTAHILDSLGFDIHGKTGTAQNAAKESHGWFVGYCTINNTKYTFGFFIENCGTSHVAVNALYELFKKIKEEKLL